MCCRSFLGALGVLRLSVFTYKERRRSARSLWPRRGTWLKRSHVQRQGCQQTASLLRQVPRACHLCTVPPPWSYRSWSLPIVRRRRASAMDAHVCRMRPGIQLFTEDGDYAVRPIHGRRLQRFTMHFGLVRFAGAIRVSYCNRSRRPFLRFSNGILFFFCIVLGSRGASLLPLTCFYFYPL